MQMAVSIPYRYKQKFAKPQKRYQGQEVSIPYRYKQNSLYFDGDRFFTDEFQSPIGTNKSQNGKLVKYLKTLLQQGF